MKILLTNDDGIEAVGLKALRCHLREFGEVCTVAPSHDKSGCGAGINCDGLIEVCKHSSFFDRKRYKVRGTPATCVRLGVQVLLPECDLVVSGINYGRNTGGNILHSGTLGACMEAASLGLPSLAISCERGENFGLLIGDKIIEDILVYFISKKYNKEDHGTFISINIPDAAPADMKELKFCRHGHSKWSGQPVLVDKRHEWSWYKLEGYQPECQEEGTDIYWLRQKYITWSKIQIKDWNA